jgi:hypothetical protein
MLRNFIIGLKKAIRLLLITVLLSSCSINQLSVVNQRTTTGNQDYLNRLKNLEFDKYLITPKYHPKQTRYSDWDVYSYPMDELRCVTGAEYFILSRQGLDSDRTVLWLDGGGACWPGRDDCTKDAQFFSWIEEHGLGSQYEKNPVKSWNFIYLPYCDGSLQSAGRSS